MAYDSGFSRRSASEREVQPVAIVSVDPTSRTAIGVTRVRSRVTINCAYATGDTITIPAVGEQWYCERIDMEWRLYGRIPFNDATLNIKPEEGQVSVGSASGPLELNGPEVRFNSKVFRLNGVYYRDSGEALERSTDQVTWTAVSAATAGTLAQELASMLAGYQGTDSSGALLAIKDWAAPLQLVAENFSQFWNLLCDNSFVTGLKGLGFGDTDVAKIIDGFQNFLNYLFGTIFCDFNGDLTPQVLLARIRDLLAPIASNPFILALQEFSTLLGGTTNGLLQDAIDGVTKFLQTLFDVLFCQADPTDLQNILDAVGDVFGPVSIIQAIEAFFDVFRLNPFLQGLSSFLQSIAPGLFTGNLLQDAVIGGTKFLSTLFGVLTCDPNSLTTLAGFFDGTPNLTTPQGILATLAGLVTSLMSNPLITAIQTFASQYLGLTGTLLQQIITGTGSLFNWFFKALTTFLPFVPWQALLPFLDWTAINDATVNGITFPSLLTTNLFSMFDGLFGGTLGAFKNFLTNLGTLFDGMGLLDAILEFDPVEAVKYLLTNVLGIASYTLDGALQFGGTLISDALGAVGAFFENIRDFFGFDLRNFAEGALTPIYMAALFLDRIEEALLSWVKTLVLGGSASLVEWAQANILVPVIGNFLTGLKIDWRTLGYSTVEDLLNAGWSSLSQIAGKLLTSLTQIPANLISGVLPPGILGTVPVSSIADVSQNLLAQGAFADGISVEANDGWIWDGTENATGTGGSVKVTVSPAKNRYLYARQAVPVAVGDRLIVNATIKTYGLLMNNPGNTPISISIIPYAGSTQASSAIQIGSASGPSSGWTTIGNSKTSPYSVTDSTWTSIIVQLKVDSGTYSGTVWWDDITVAKTGTLLQGNVDSLNTAWNQVIGGLKNTGQSTTGLDWTSLYEAAHTARQQADYGYNYSTGTNQTLFGSPTGGSTFYSPQSLISSLFSVSADGANSIGTLLNVLTYYLSNGGNPGSTVSSVSSAASAINTSATTAYGRIKDTNIKLFANEAGGTTFSSPSSLITSLASVKADGFDTMSVLLGYLIAGLSGSTVSGSTVAQVVPATSVVSTSTGRINDTNTKLFGAPQGGNNGKVLTTALDLTSLNSVGSGVLLRKTAANAYTTVYNASGVRLPYSFFDTPFTSTPDITVFNDTAQPQYYNPGTGTGPGNTLGIRAANTGWYQIEIGYKLRGGGDNIKFGYSWNLTPCLFKQGSVGPVKMGSSSTWTCINSAPGFFNGFGQDNAQSSFIYYLYANEVIYPGYFFNSDGIYIPTTDNIIQYSGIGGTYFSMSLLNKSLA